MSSDEDSVSALLAALSEHLQPLRIEDPLDPRVVDRLLDREDLRGAGADRIRQERRELWRGWLAWAESRRVRARRGLLAARETPGDLLPWLVEVRWHLMRLRLAGWMHFAGLPRIRARASAEALTRLLGHADARPSEWPALTAESREAEPADPAIARDLPPLVPSGPLTIMQRLVSEDLRWLPRHLEGRVRRAHLSVFLLLIPEAARDVRSELCRQADADLDGALRAAATAFWNLATLSAGGIWSIAFGGPSRRAGAAASRLHQMTQPVRGMR